jgi:glycosyltransferase involved in cell wall biosynthesis
MTLFPAAIIIPTYNRADALSRCLQYLERQTFADFEVIVVDDGSTDGTEQQMRDYLGRSPLHLSYVRQSNAGPARARNVAVQMVRSPLCLIIGDDIFCAPEFAARHVQYHRNHPEQNRAALGLTRWSETGQTVTPFMRWMDASGTQFAYHDILSGTTPDWRFFYTSNLSVKTELLRKHPFSEEFPFANMEDMELGYRLEKEEGLRVDFVPEALAEHFHPIDFRGACTRAWRTGLSLQVFDRLWPDRPRSKHGLLYRKLKDLLCRNSWLVRPLTGVTAWLLPLWCPNPLIGLTLALHTEVAHRSSARCRDE